MKKVMILCFFSLMILACSSGESDKEDENMSEEEVQTEMESIDDRMKRDQERYDSMRRALDLDSTQ